MTNKQPECHNCGGALAPVDVVLCDHCKCRSWRRRAEHAEAAAASSRDRLQRLLDTAVQLLADARPNAGAPETKCAWFEAVRDLTRRASI